jgi:hypothetical protein
MSSTLDRANELVAALTAAGVRAGTDPSAAAPPCILVPPPGRTYDTGCGFTARWELIALAPAPTGANRSTWGTLDDLVDKAAQALDDVATAQLVTYSLNGLDYPAFLLGWTEAIG